ncbi:putative FMN-dependent luciferase-like monooxygenase [Acidisoma silvae]|uniref:FMN-dependent luciferase-like monooxygenase n=1 Tax=Acidisoma silvae TaxID=2802396 RepID=A0A964E154_9PROT|nr:putative FMN-dependent luciferase-like monooxygenase [Acidisoma silvae]MCB8877996.1 putative FMN-dependent luciferase-like monooxygenase [Acidisoma silvae]
MKIESTQGDRRKSLCFFTRLLDDVPPLQRYGLATAQIVAAERLGFDIAWVAQHHFHPDEGGLPAPLVFLAQVAARTERIRLGTGVITLPMEHPVRVAEDTAVLDLLSGGRLEVGFGSGGTPSSFAAFGQDSERRNDIFTRYLRVVLDAWAGRGLGPGENVLYPTTPDLARRVWQATFSEGGGVRAGKAGDGLMLSRTQPRPPGQQAARLWDIQQPIVDAYHKALSAGIAPRVLASRSVFVTDRRPDAWAIAELGLSRAMAFQRSIGNAVPEGSLESIVAAYDMHIGTPDDVIRSLGADPVVAVATHVAVQAHSADPPHEMLLRSLELIRREVAPALGWV